MMAAKFTRTLTPAPEDNSKETVVMEVFQAALNGDKRRLDALIRKRGDVSLAELLGRVSPRGQQRFTPLIGAACRGHLAVVLLLLDKYGVDTEQTGSVVLENVSFTGVTALWCSVAFSHFDVTKCLVAHGADVNHGTLCNTSPLHAVSCDDQLDAVEFLVERGADLAVASKKGTTCLMIYCTNGLRSLVKFLIDRGVDLNRQDNRGRTALHFAAKEGHLNIMRDLIKAGAVFKKDVFNMTPLSVAAANGQTEVVEYVIRLKDITQEDEVDALELLGATLALDLFLFDNLKLGYKYMKQGMRARFRGGYVPKPDYPPVPTYANTTESKAMSELRGKSSNSSAFINECLTARERILGPDNPEVCVMLASRAGHLTERGCFHDAISLLVHAAELSMQKPHKDLPAKGVTTMLNKVFCRMVQMGFNVKFQDFQPGLKNAMLETKLRAEKCLTSSTEMRRYREDVYATLNLADMALAALSNEEEFFCINDLVENIVAQVRELQAPFTTLHVAVEILSQRRVYIGDLTPDDGVSLMSLLLAAGADANRRDASSGKTALHLLAEKAARFPVLSILHETMWALIGGGAHVDARDIEGRTPVDVATSKEVKEALKSLFPLSLKCLAANAAVTNGISYKGTVPVLVEQFVDVHCPTTQITKS